MPSLTILDRLLKQLRYDENKKKANEKYLKYQTWFGIEFQIFNIFLIDFYILPE